MSETAQGVLIGAVIASLTALLTLLTERWKVQKSTSTETAAWRRETMFSIAHRYLDIGFALSGTSSNARRDRVRGSTLESVQPYLDNCHQLHAELTTHLTGLRLIAPRSVVLAAQKMHDSHHLLVNAAMGRVEPNSTEEGSLESWRALKRQAASSRLSLLTEMRAVFGIESDVVPFRRSLESSWSVPADEYDPDR